MKDYSKILIEDIIAKAKMVDKKERMDNGSLEIKISDKDIKNILARKRLRKGLKDNLVQDLIDANFKASNCDTSSLCVVIPKDKLEKKIIKYSDIT